MRDMCVGCHTPVRTTLTKRLQLPPISSLAYHPAVSPNNSSSHTQDKGLPTFGVDLAEQLARDDAEVPPIMVKCCEAIERYGLRSQGIYRVGGTITKVKDLRERLDKGPSLGPWRRLRGRSERRGCFRPRRREP